MWPNLKNLIRQGWIREESWSPPCRIRYCWTEPRQHAWGAARALREKYSRQPPHWGHDVSRKRLWLSSDWGYGLEMDSGKIWKGPRLALSGCVLIASVQPSTEPCVPSTQKVYDDGEQSCGACNWGSWSGRVDPGRSPTHQSDHQHHAQTVAATIRTAWRRQRLKAG